MHKIPPDAAFSHLWDDQIATPDYLLVVCIACGLEAHYCVATGQFLGKPVACGQAQIDIYDIIVGDL